MNPADVLIGVVIAALTKIAIDMVSEVIKRKAIDPLLAKYLGDVEYWDAVDRWLDQTYDLGQSVIEALREQGKILSGEPLASLVELTAQNFDWRLHFTKARYKAMTIDQLNNQL